MFEWRICNKNYPMIFCLNMTNMSLWKIFFIITLVSQLAKMLFMISSYTTFKRLLRMHRFTYNFIVTCCWINLLMFLSQNVYILIHLNFLSNSTIFCLKFYVQLTLSGIVNNQIWILVIRNTLFMIILFSCSNESHFFWIDRRIKIFWC